MSVEPANMPVEGGLRIRVATDSSDSTATVQIGDAQTSDLQISASFAYATAPPLDAGSYDVTLVADSTTDQVGTIAYVDDFVSAAQAAVDAYAVALEELAGEAAGVTDDQTRERLLADLMLRSNDVDNVIVARATMTGQDLDQPEIDNIWSTAAPSLESLQEQIAGDPTS